MGGRRASSFFLCLPFRSSSSLCAHYGLIMHGPHDLSSYGSYSPVMLSSDLIWCVLHYLLTELLVISRRMDLTFLRLLWNVVGDLYMYAARNRSELW